MPAGAEYFFRPRNWFVRLIARLIGAPPCGVVRCGPQYYRLSDPYEAAVAFVAPDFHNAELKALGGRKITPADLKEASSVLAEDNLRATFTRRRSDGSIRKQWRSTMATTLNKAPHGPDGKIDLAKAKESLDHMVTQVEAGHEHIIGVYRVDQADGTHQTIIHHKAA